MNSRLRSRSPRDRPRACCRCPEREARLREAAAQPEVIHATLHGAGGVREEEGPCVRAREEGCRGASRKERCEEGARAATQEARSEERSLSG